MPMQDICVQVAPTYPVRQFSVDRGVLNFHIPKIGYYILTWSTNTQGAFIQKFSGFERRSLQDSLCQFFQHLGAFRNGGELTLFRDEEKALRQAGSDEARRRAVVQKWHNTVQDICDVLGHDEGLGCSNFLFEHLLASLEILLPELQKPKLKAEIIQLFLSFAKVFRGTRQVYLDRLHAVWNGLKKETRDEIFRKMNLDRHGQGLDMELDRMVYAIENPRKPVNKADFDED